MLPSRETPFSTIGWHSGISDPVNIGDHHSPIDAARPLGACLHFIGKLRANQTFCPFVSSSAGHSRFWPTPVPSTDNMKDLMACMEDGHQQWKIQRGFQTIRILRELGDNRQQRELVGFVQLSRNSRLSISSLLLSNLTRQDLIDKPYRKGTAASTLSSRRSVGCDRHSPINKGRYLPCVNLDLVRELFLSAAVSHISDLVVSTAGSNR